MAKWEYARLESSAEGVSVVFSHRQPWQALPPESFFDALRLLGDEGWELVSALPLGASTRQMSAADVSFRVGTDRWLMFKREAPAAPPPQGGGEGADLLKGLVTKQLLKGRFPLP